METDGIYTYTGNYVCSNMPEKDEEEVEPLTWHREFNSVKYVPHRKRLPEHNINSNSNVAISNAKGEEYQPNKPRAVISAWRKKKNQRRRPRIVILAIALTFIVVFVSVLLVSLYFKMVGDKQTNTENPNTDTTISEPVLDSTSAPNTTISPTTTIYASVTKTSSSNLMTSNPATTPSLTTRIIQHSSTINPTTPTTIEVTTQYGEFTTIVEETPRNLPIFYMSGPFTYKEAILACEREGTKLALKEDIEQAWKEGYNRCTLGWLRDMHTAMIVQENYASTDCEKGAVGAIYKPAREPTLKYSGAYCVKENQNSPDSESLNITSNPDKTINWWVTNDPADVYNLRHTLMLAKSENDITSYPLMTSLKSIYTCCNAFNITYTNIDGSPRSYVKQRYSVDYFKTLIEMYHRELAPVKVITHVTATYDAMMKYGAATTNRREIVSSLVEMAIEVNLDGLIIDYEPREDYTREHADSYRIFLDDLASELSKYGMSLGTVISSWGILKYYDIYANSKVDFIGTMSSTYYGHNTDSNKQHVSEMMEVIDTDRLEIGLGLMHDEDLLPNPRRDYRWSEERLEDFIKWSGKQGIKRIHVYPGEWRSHRASEKYFLQTLADFSEGNI